MAHREFEKGKPNSTKEEMNAIANKAAAGDEEAKHELGALMQPFVIGYLRTIKGDYTRDQRDELTQSAWLGVWDALSRWDSSRDVKFNTYAHFWMKHWVFEWLAENSGVISIPRSAWKDAAKVEEHVREQYGEEVLATEIPDEELAAIEIASGDRRFRSAGDAFRARQQPYAPDENWEPQPSDSAEADFFEVEDDMEAEALAVLELCEYHISNGEEWRADDEAYAFTLKHGLPEQVANNIIQTAQERQI